MIKIGYKNDKGYPQSVDYFIPNGKYKKLFTDVYGDKPSTIQIIFPDDDATKVCNERYEYRDDKGALVAYGDGETFNVFNGKTYSEYTISKHPDLLKRIAEKNPNSSVKKGEDGWSVVLSLKFVIPLIRGVVGVWEFITKGTESTIPQITGVFDKVLEERGMCRGIVFDLSVQFATSQKPNTKSRYPVVSLIPNESQENINRIREALKPIKMLE